MSVQSGLGSGLGSDMRQTHSRIVELATLAPSVRNSQPWYWVSDGEQLELVARARAIDVGAYVVVAAATGKGLTGARTDEEDPIEHLFVASTHDWLLVFTTLGKVFSLRVFELPELARDAKGRALVNILEFETGEKVADCRSVSGFEDPNQFLLLTSLCLVELL